MLIAPTEQQSGIPKKLDEHGIAVHSSTYPETLGADYTAKTIAGLWAMQRKTTSDFVSSLPPDDRLVREVAALRWQEIPWLVIEGSWEDAAIAMERGHWTMSALRKQMTNVRREGIWVDFTTCAGETVQWIVAQLEYWSSERHDSLLTRPRAPRAIRHASKEREEQLHAIMGWPGLGRKRAENILDELGFPISWTCTPEELAGVPLMGEITARRVMRYGKDRP